MMSFGKTTTYKEKGFASKGRVEDAFEISEPRHHHRPRLLEDERRLHLLFA